METIRKTRLVHRKLKEENNCLPFCVYLFSLFRFNFVRWKRHCHGSDYYSVMSPLKKMVHRRMAIVQTSPLSEGNTDSRGKQY